ncbi:MAG TPA: hypothetical protein ENN28_04335 [Candidatus Uhrbacteria bacterium]|nr:hypothetical protein [Candidatus Uhrbacteria bacterium]
MFKIRMSEKSRFPFGFDENNYQVGIGSEIADPDLLIVDNEKLSEAEIPDSVLGIIKIGLFDVTKINIPVEFCTKRGVVVFSSPKIYRQESDYAVREAVVWSIINASRNFMQINNWLDSNFKELASLPSKPRTFDLRLRSRGILNQKVFVIGLGTEGRLVAKALMQIGMDVYGYDPYVRKLKDPLLKDITLLNKLEKGCQIADFITLHAPLYKETIGLISKPQLDSMKSEVVIINFSKPELINQPGLYSQLKANNIGSYYSDQISPEFMESPLPNAVFLVGLKEGHLIEDASQIKKISIEFLKQGTIESSINFPDSHLPNHGICRLIITNENIAGIIGKITGIIASFGINIAAMLNVNQGEIGYNIIDLDQCVDSKIIEKFKSQGGIIKARLI